MSVNLYLVRSGETTFEWQFPERRRWAGLTANRDEQGIVQGRLDEFLNPRGLMQAHIQADKLDKVDFERAWCSSQNRAVQTADVILYSHPTVDLSLNRGLNDRAQGCDEGHRWETRQEEAPDAEPWSSVHNRMRLFLLDALSAVPTGTKPVNILIVTHLPCLMVLDQVLPEVGVDLEGGKKAQTPVIQPEQVAILHLQKQGTRWIGTVEHQ